MGNTIVSAGDGGDEGASQWMKAAGIAIDEEHYRKVANAKDIDRRTYNSRQHQDYLKPEEVLECEKFRIQDTYGMSVTPELVRANASKLLLITTKVKNQRKNQDLAFDYFLSPKAIA